MADSPYTSPKIYFPVIGLILILAAITWLGLQVDPGDRATTWGMILALMTAFAVLVGRGITGHWRGILIDSRNKMSLSRLQLLAWTLVVLSALVTAVLSNVAMGSAAPLEIDIPSALWALMGISTGSAVGSQAILGSANNRKVDPKLLTSVAKRFKTADAVTVDTENQSIVVKNTSQTDARWSDLLKGDQVGNAEHVDMGKLQMFFFTFILIVGYGAAVGAGFAGTEFTTMIPNVEDGMNVLLGISQTGYLASKAVVAQTPTIPA